MKKEIDHEYTDEVVCPYCGHEHSDSWEYGDGGIVDCDGCEKKFFFERDVVVTYVSAKSPCSNGEAEHEFNYKNDWLIKEGTKAGQIQNTCRKCHETVYRISEPK
jgi:hypothetical protein